MAKTLLLKPAPKYATGTSMPALLKARKRALPIPRLNQRANTKKGQIYTSSKANNPTLPVLAAALRKFVVWWSYPSGQANGSNTLSAMRVCSNLYPLYDQPNTGLVLYKSTQAPHLQTRPYRCSGSAVFGKTDYFVARFFHPRFNAKLQGRLQQTITNKQNAKYASQHIFKPDFS